jgi:integrase
MPSGRLSDTFIRNLKPVGRARKFFDGGGLYLFLSPAGGRLWRLDYRFASKYKTLSLWQYPYLTLKEARRQVEKAKTLLAHGTDPGEHKKAVKKAAIQANANSYEIIAREWLEKFFNHLSAGHKVKVLARQSMNIFPFLGARPVNQITPPELLQVLRRLEQRGALYSAHRVLQECSQIFRFAISTGRAQRDPCADLKGALPPAGQRRRAAITEPQAAAKLLRAIDNYQGKPIVALALKLAPLLMARPGELRQALWAEFDLRKAEWRIPAARMKMRQQHIVPLSRQSIALLQELRQYSGKGQLLFPGFRNCARPLSDATLLNALRHMGFAKEVMTVHGFRSMASTLLNERGYNRDWIERQLAHGERDKIRAAYNYAEYLPERRRMMQEWADYLDELKACPRP